MGERGGVCRWIILGWGFINVCPRVFLTLIPVEPGHLVATF